MLAAEYLHRSVEHSQNQLNDCFTIALFLFQNVTLLVVALFFLHFFSVVELFFHSNRCGFSFDLIHQSLSLIRFLHRKYTSEHRNKRIRCIVLGVIWSSFCYLFNVIIRRDDSVPEIALHPFCTIKTNNFVLKSIEKKKQPSKFLKPNNYPITQSTNKGAHWNRPNQIDRPKQKMKVQNEIISEHTSFDDNIGKRQSGERKKHTIELEVVAQRARCAQLQLQCKWNAPIQFCVAFFFLLLSLLHLVCCCLFLFFETSIIYLNKSYLGVDMYVAI